VSIGSFFRSIPRALSRSKIFILTIALVYAFSLVVGIAMVDAGNQFALSTRDSVVAGATSSDPASIALQNGDNLEAAFIDFGRNLALGAVPSTVGGLAVVIPYPVAAYRGWIGGIVSADANHASRLDSPGSALYYLSVVILQLVPYSLAGGVGVNLGVAFLRPRPYYMGTKWIGLPKEAILDVLRVYAVVVPLFLVASLIEFLA
jgi:hypothetical protein